VGILLDCGTSAITASRSGLVVSYLSMYRSGYRVAVEVQSLAPLLGSVDKAPIAQTKRADSTMNVNELAALLLALASVQRSSAVGLRKDPLRACTLCKMMVNNAPRCDLLLCQTLLLRTAGSIIQRVVAIAVRCSCSSRV
jgi:hypothetical protein